LFYGKFLLKFTANTAAVRLQMKWV